MVNDEFGHKAGDNVLKEFAQLIKEFLPKTAFFGRWGGEEFLIIFNGPLEKAAEWAEDLRKRISKHGFAVGSRQTASFGVTDFQPGETTDAMLGRADMGLYESKNQGRNQITLV
jgi:diguanylate cyclase (GGDEF)-like protein